MRPDPAFVAYPARRRFVLATLGLVAVLLLGLIYLRLGRKS